MNGNAEKALGVARSYGGLLRMTGVHKHYGGGFVGVHALKSVDLRLAAGEMVCICGPSGSGKTSLLNLIAMLEPITDGSLVIADLLTTKLTEQARADLRSDIIGLVMQAFTLIPVMTVRENVLLPLLMRGKLDGVALQAAHLRAADLLRLLGLGNKADQYPLKLDASQSQRVAIARALIGKPRLVLADEPASRLDNGCIRLVMDLFVREQAEQGTAFLITTRDQRQLSRVTRTLQLSEGRLQSAADAGGRKPYRTPA